MQQVSAPRVVQVSADADADGPVSTGAAAPGAVRRPKRRGLPIPTRRAIVAATIPSAVVFLVFWRWLGFSLPLAAALGTVWALASLLVTRSVYDDAELELVAWREAAPELALGAWSAAGTAPDVLPAGLTDEDAGTPEPAVTPAAIVGPAVTPAATGAAAVTQ